MMKRFVAGIICVIMLTLCAGTGLAVQAQYPNTIAFLKKMDDLGITYTVEGINEKEQEKITIKNSGDQISYTLVYFFNKDNTECDIRVWYVLYYDAAEFDNVLRAVNKLNNTYKYCTWIADDSDSTITVTCDVILRENGDVGDIVTDATMNVVDIIDDAYANVLGVYDINAAPAAEKTP